MDAVKPCKLVWTPCKLTKVFIFLLCFLGAVPRCVLQGHDRGATMTPQKAMRKKRCPVSEKIPRGVLRNL